MVTLNKSINIQGVSTINEVQIAFMNANIPIDGKVNINKSIQNKEAFEQNKEEVMKDFLAFEEYVYSLIPEEEIAKE